MRWVVALVVCMASCNQPLVDDTFTPEQWATLQASMRVPAVTPACIGIDESKCAAAAALGSALFVDPALSGSGVIPDANPGSGMVACADCHASGSDFIDPRPNANVSLGTKFTGHNALSLVNIGIKEVLVHDQPAPVFTWTGAFNSAADVFTKLALPKAMHGDASTVTKAVLANELAAYTAVFGDPVPQSPDEVLANVAIAFDAYERTLVSVDSPFDRFLAGDDSALTAQEKHGFELFAGDAICIECHNGPLLTDLQFHNTGVAQVGLHVGSDVGRGSETENPDDIGAFLTPSLRNVALSAPYMNAGQLATLADVVAFYRRGGDAVGFEGTRDPRIEPLDLSDDDAADLVAFLTTLTGSAPTGTP